MIQACSSVDAIFSQCKIASKVATVGPELRSDRRAPRWRQSADDVGHLPLVRQPIELLGVNGGTRVPALLSLEWMAQENGLGSLRTGRNDIDRRVRQLLDALQVATRILWQMGGVF